MAGEGVRTTSNGGRLNSLKKFFSSPYTYLTSLALLGTFAVAEPALGQGKDKNPESKNINMSNLDAIQAEALKYYPSMGTYINEVFAKIKTPELKNRINTCLQATVMKSKYTGAQLLSIIIACLEETQNTTVFGDKYGDIFDDGMLAETEKFSNMYITGYDDFLAEQDATIQKLDATIQKQESENKEKEIKMRANLAGVSIEKIKNSKTKPDRIILAKQYFDLNKIKPTDHEQEIFDALE